MKRRRSQTKEPPAAVPSRPRPIPDVEIPQVGPDLWGDEGAGGAYPGGPTGTPRDREEKPR
jgi:hypothetical protein